jgi:putative hydrolase of the HAD superfamily
MATRHSPGAILLDLDDTILDNEGTIPGCWRVVCADVARERPNLDAEQLNAAIKRAADWFWSEPERQRTGRLAPHVAGLRIVHDALISFGHDDRDLAGAIYDAYRYQRQAAVQPFPGAIEALERLIARDVRLALVTNGSAAIQRARIERFGLARYFAFILVESEFGVGKPDERVYRAAMKALGSAPATTWMVGDNFEWEVIVPGQLGLGTVWIDRLGAGVYSDAPVTPDHIIATLSQLPDLLL